MKSYLIVADRILYQKVNTYILADSPSDAFKRAMEKLQDINSLNISIDHREISEVRPKQIYIQENSKWKELDLDSMI